MKLGNSGIAVPIIKSLCGIYVVKTFVIEPVGTVGPSMLPTIDLTTSFFLVEKISTRFGKVDRGDILVFRDPEKPNAIMVKRVVGLGGDMVRRISNPETSKLEGGSSTNNSNPETSELEGDSVAYSSHPETNDLVGDSSAQISHPKNNDKPDTFVIPKGTVWIEGDNKNNSRDSRKFGPVPCDYIRGRIFWRVYPFNKFGPFWNK